MKRREFLSASGAVLTGSLLGAVRGAGSVATAAPARMIGMADWRALRGMFPLTHDYIHLATFLLSSHPRPVADAIERHRHALDENPSDYWHAHFETIDDEIAAAAARYLGGEGEQIALTDGRVSRRLFWSSTPLRPG